MDNQDDYLGRVVEQMLGSQAGEVVSRASEQTSVGIDSPLGMLIGVAFVLFAIASVLKTPSVKIVTETSADLIKDARMRQNQRIDDELKTADKIALRRQTLLAELAKLDDEEG